jgi:hypothetical protein
MQAFTESEQGKQAIVYSGQMAYQVEEAILAGCDLGLKLFVSECGKALIEATDNKLP